MTEPTPGQMPATPTPPVEPVTPVAPVTPVTNEPDTFSREYVEELRRENAKYRTSAKDAEERAKTEEAKTLAEQGKFKELADKRETELVELRASIKEDRIKSAIMLEATKVGVIDPEAAYVLADLSKTDVNEAGGVTGATEAIAALVKGKPYLVQVLGKPAPNIGATNPAGGGGVTIADIKNMTAAQIAAMTPDEYALAIAALKAK